MGEDAERQNILAEIAEAFAVPRPAWFVNAKHCCECAETEAALQALSPAAVDLRIAGSGGPFTLISNPDGFKYFLPALARLAYDSQYLRDFLSQIWYLRTDTFDIRQRAAVEALLMHLAVSLAPALTDDDYIELEWALRRVRGEPGPCSYAGPA